MGQAQHSRGLAVCPVCEKTWPAATEVCPNDGSWLLEATRLDPDAPGNLGFADTNAVVLDRTFENDSMTPFRFPDTTLEERPAVTLEDDTPAPASRELAPGTRCGDYEIELKIGQGAMGAVYRAVHPTIGKHVAIKVMSAKLFAESDAHKRFVAEARAVAAIRHPGIVEIFGIGALADGRTFLTMQWLDGESLGARLARERVTLEDSLEIMRQIARALEAAHAKQIVHRDLKPENVFLLRAGDEMFIKLLDFGLAKGADAVGVTRSGEIVGTPLYMSPEQCRGKSVDHRTDIYALGCLAFELVTGRVPFLHDNTADVISAHLNDAPPSASALRPDLPPPLDRLLVQMLAKRAEERPTLPAVRQILDEVRQRTSQPIAAQPAAEAHDDEQVTTVRRSEEAVDSGIAFASTEQPPSRPSKTTRVAPAPSAPTSRAIVLAVIVIVALIAAAIVVVLGTSA